MASGWRSLGLLSFLLAAPEVCSSVGAAEGLDEIGRLDQLNERAVQLEASGSTPEARHLFDEALSGFRRLGDREGQTIVLGNLGALLESSGDFDEALALFEEAEAVATAASGPEAPAWAPRRAAIARINQATALEKTSDYAAAYERLRRDLENPGPLDSAERVGLWTNAGVLVRNLGDPRGALRLFDRAWDAAREVGDLATQANVRLNRALAWSLDLESPKEARAEFSAAADLARRSGDHAELVQTLFYLGRFEMAEGHLTAAEEAFSSALSEARESDNAEGRWSALEGLGRLALERGQPSQASELFGEAVREIERTRSRLADRLRRAGYFGDRRGAYEGWIAAVLQGGSTGRIERALEISEAARARDLLDAWQQRDEGFEVAFRLKQGTERGPTLAFFSVDGRLLRFVLDGSSITVAERGLTADLRTLTERVTRGWFLGRRAPEERLLADRLLGELPSRRRWNVVLDVALSSLPIDALPTDDGEPWFESTTVRLWPSVAAIDRLGSAQLRAPAALRYFGIGSPSAVGFAELPASRSEIESAEHRFAPRARTRVGAAASEAAFREVPPVDLLHLATHAARHSGETALVLSPAAGGDGWLTASEIAPLHLDVGTVLLSACRAGSEGIDRRGAALSGLSGAFLAAGARGVIAPLWDVRDADAAAISEQLLARLARGEDPAEALREVKRTFRSDPRWASPDRWAAWVAVGAPEVPAPTLRPLGWLAVVGVAGLAIWLTLRFSGTKGRRPRS